MVYFTGSVLGVDDRISWLKLGFSGLALVLIGWYEAHSSEVWRKLYLERKFWEEAINGKKSKRKRTNRDKDSEG